MSYRVEVLEEVRDLDVPELLAVDRDLARVLVEKVRELHFDPWIGQGMRELHGTGAGTYALLWDRFRPYAAQVEDGHSL